MSSKEKKAAFMKRLYENLSKYNQIVIVNVMNVGSGQIQEIRRDLRGKNSDLLIGKNVPYPFLIISDHDQKSYQMEGRRLPRRP